MKPVVMISENQAKITYCSMQFPGKSAEGKTVPGKIKITIKQVRDASEDDSSEKNAKGIVENGQRNRVIGGVSKRSVVNVLAKASMAVNSGKQRPEIPLDGQTGKKQKQNMDRNLKIHLLKILKELIHHPSGWIFREPVDPVKLQIPNYFSIISQPMDLGTILHKLDGDMYSGADEFAADVRLTFSNAMLYNSRGSKVHYWAEKLDAAFSRKWKLLEAKLKHGKRNDEKAKFIDCMGNKVRDAKQIVENNHQSMKPISLNKAPLPVKHGPMSHEEKQKFRLEIVQVLNRKMVEKLRTVFRKFGLAGLDKEKLDSYIDLADDETLWKLRREVKVLLGARDGKVKPGKIALIGCSSLHKIVEKEHCSRSALASAGSTNHRHQARCSSCVSLECHCLGNDSSLVSASDVSYQKTAEHNHCGDSKLESKVKYPSESLTSICDPDSDGCTFNVTMSPKKALRAAMLKKRFADTIFKATHQELLDHTEKSHPLMMQQEKEKMEREQREEKARIEAQIKTAEAASRRREQEDLKTRCEIEREAARMALEKIAKTVEVDDDVGTWKDLVMMGCGYLYYPVDENGLGSDGIHHGNPLEQLGLYVDDFLEEDEDAILDREEGEIPSCSTSPDR